MTQPLNFDMPPMADLIAEYAECWFEQNGKGRPPAKGTMGLHAFCVGSADNVHDSYLDCTVAFAHDFERELEAHIKEKS